MYGQTREIVHEKWVKLQAKADAGAGPDEDPDPRPVPRALAGRGRRAEPRAGHLRLLRGDGAAVHHPGAGREADRPAPDPRRADMAQQAGQDLPVLRPGQGRRPAGEPAALLRDRRRAARTTQAAGRCRPPATSCGRLSTTPRRPTNWCPGTSRPSSRCPARPSAAAGARSGASRRRAGSWPRRATTTTRCTPRTS